MELAALLKRWLPSVIQSIDAYYTPEDIAKGARWSEEIAGELSKARVGIVLLTPENLHAPWVHFEAGALAKGLDTSRVCPILFGVDSSDVDGPLAQFQIAQFDRPDIQRVMSAINAELGASALGESVLIEALDLWWPRLEEQVRGVMNLAPSASLKSQRPSREVLEETLGLVRKLANDREVEVSARLVLYTTEALKAVIASLQPNAWSADLASALAKARNQIQYAFQNHVKTNRLHIARVMGLTQLKNADDLLREFAELNDLGAEELGDLYQYIESDLVTKLKLEPPDS